MLTAAAAALTRTDDTAGVVLIGGAVTLLSWVLTPAWVAGVLFVSPAVAVAAPLALGPWLVARGYFVRVTRSATQTGEATGAPSLVAWGELVRDGVKSALVSAALLAPLAGGLVVASVAVAALVVGPVDPGPAAAAVESTLGPNGPAAVAVVAGGVVAAFAGAYLLAFAYVRPAALAAFAASGRLRDGLNPRTVADVAATGSYATGWTLAVGALAVGYAVAVPTAPLVVGVAVAFLARVVAHGLYGRGAADALTQDAIRDTEVRPSAGAARDGARSADRTARDGARSADRTARRTDATRGDAPIRGTDRARTDPSIPVVSGDGGRPMRDEPPATVQVGRDVLVGGSDDAVGGDAADVTDASDADEEGDAAAGEGAAGEGATGEGAAAGEGAAGGFEWGPPLSDGEDKG